MADSVDRPGWKQVVRLFLSVGAAVVVLGLLGIILSIGSGVRFDTGATAGTGPASRSRNQRGR